MGTNPFGNLRQGMEKKDRVYHQGGEATFKGREFKKILIKVVGITAYIIQTYAMSVFKLIATLCGAEFHAKEILVA